MSGPGSSMLTCRTCGRTYRIDEVLFMNGTLTCPFCNHDL